MRSTNLSIFIIALIVTLSSGIKMKKGNLLTSPVISTGLTNIKYQPTTSGIVTQANPSLYGYGYSSYPYYSSSSTIAQVDPYMINYGYSADFVEMYNKIQARSNGEPYDYKPSEDPIYKYQPFKSIKRLIYYFDPSSDTSQFLNHDIKNYPNYNDY